jgi:hypothetical protein
MEGDHIDALIAMEGDHIRLSDLHLLEPLQPSVMVPRHIKPNAVRARVRLRRLHRRSDPIEHLADQSCDHIRAVAGAVGLIPHISRDDSISNYSLCLST